MRSEMPRLDGLFRGRIYNLRFGVVVWATQALSMVVWWFKYNGEALWSSEVTIPAGGQFADVFLSQAAMSVIMILILGVYHWRTCRAYSSYKIRLRIADATREFAEMYHVARPFIYEIRDLLYIDMFCFVFLLAFGLVSALSFSSSFLLAYTLPTMVPNPFSDAMTRSAIAEFWANLQVLFGINALVLWVFVSWSALSLLKTYRMYELVRAENRHGPVTSL